MINLMRELAPEERLALSLVANQALSRTLGDIGKDHTTHAQEVTVNGKLRTVEGIVEREKYDSIEHKLKQAAGLSEELTNQLLSACTLKDDEEFANQKDRTVNSHGTLLASFTSGGFELFDNPILVHNALSLTISTAETHNSFRDKGDHEPVRVMGGRELLEVLLSPEQWVRVLRSEAVSVPCTISRSNGYIHDRPESLDLEEIKIMDDLEASLNGLCAPVAEAARYMVSLLGNAPVTSKKAMDELYGAVDALEDAIEKVTPNISDRQQEAIDDLVCAYSGRLEMMIQEETNRLPVELRDEAVRYLPKLTD